MITLTKSAFAKQQGWSPSYVTKLIGQERLVLNESGLVKVTASLEKIKATAGARGDVAARNASERKATKRGKKPEPATLNIPLDELPEGSRAKYKAVVMHYENQLQKLNMALMQSLRFDNRAVRDEAAGIGNTLRAAIERLIDTTAPRLAIAKTREERERILLAEITAMRKTIKNTFPRAMLRLAKQKGL
jgi:hypothetical protein